MTEVRKNGQYKIEKPIIINREGLEIKITPKETGSKSPITYDIGPQATSDFNRGYDHILTESGLDEDAKVLFSSGGKNSFDVATKSADWLRDLYGKRIVGVVQILNSTMKYVAKLENRIARAKSDSEPKGKDVGLLACFGGQSPQDVVKTVAYRKGIPYVAIYGIISSDGFASDRAVIRKPKRYPKSQQAVAPKYLFIDTEQALYFDKEMDVNYPKILSSGIADILVTKVAWSAFDFKKQMQEKKIPNNQENRAALKLVEEPMVEIEPDEVVDLIKFIRERRDESKNFDGFRDYTGVRGVAKFGVENDAEAMRLAKSSMPCSMADHDYWRVIDRITHGKVKVVNPATGKLQDQILLHGITTTQGAFGYWALYEKLYGERPGKYSFEELRAFAEQVGIPIQPRKIGISNELYVRGLITAGDINLGKPTFAKDLRQERHDDPHEIEEILRDRDYRILV